MKHAKHLYTDIPAYKKWIKARDQALEQLHTRAQLEMADLMRGILANTLMMCKAHYESLKMGNSHAVDQLDQQLKMIFSDATHRACNIISSLRQRAYTLAKASEAEIIARLNPKKTVKASVTHSDLSDVHGAHSLAGGPVLQRATLYMDRLRRKVLNQAQSSALNAPTAEAFLIDVMQSFPQTRVVKRPKRILKPKLMESGPWDNWAPPQLNSQIISDNPPADVAIDNIDDAAWQDMLDAYKNDFLPKTRGPEYIVNMPVSDADTWYAWEFERDMTNEFVQSVRDGQVEAATDNGITDFVWIAVVDAVTDACCLWRDGLLVSEIAAQLSDHSDEDGECSIDGDGLTPPIHFNCRCSLAPATDDIPSKPNDNGAEFDDWLMQ